jgi:hypothetical protein
MSKKKLSMPFADAIPDDSRTFVGVFPGAYWVDKFLDGKTDSVTITQRGIKCGSLHVLNVLYLPLSLIPPDILMMHFDPRCYTLGGLWAMLRLDGVFEYNDMVSVVFFEVN